MITIWSILFAIIAGVDLGYGLGLIIKQGQIGLGILYLIFAIFFTIQAIGHIRVRVRVVPKPQLEGEDDDEKTNEDN